MSHILEKAKANFTVIIIFILILITMFLYYQYEKAITDCNFYWSEIIKERICLR